MVSLAACWPGLKEPRFSAKKNVLTNIAVLCHHVTSFNEGAILKAKKAHTKNQEHLKSKRTPPELHKHLSDGKDALRSISEHVVTSWLVVDKKTPIIIHKFQ